MSLHDLQPVQHVEPDSDGGSGGCSPSKSPSFGPPANRDQCQPAPHTSGPSTADLLELSPTRVDNPHHQQLQQQQQQPQQQQQYNHHHHHHHQQRQQHGGGYRQPMEPFQSLYTTAVTAELTGPSPSATPTTPGEDPTRKGLAAVGAAAPCPQLRLMTTAPCREETRRFEGGRGTVAAAAAAAAAAAQCNGRRSNSERRDRINERERDRMHLLCDAFERLRQVLPLRRPRRGPHRQKLSKISTLLFAQNYIRTLEDVLRNPAEYSDCRVAQLSSSAAELQASDAPCPLMSRQSSSSSSISPSPSSPPLLGASRPEMQLATDYAAYFGGPAAELCQQYGGDVYGLDQAYPHYSGIAP